MNIKDYSFDELDELISKAKSELTYHNKESKRLKSIIEQASNIIEKLSYKPNADRLRINTLIKRDLELCLDYIIKFNKVPTRELINLLNKELKNKETRWKGEIDSNIFMSSMGTYLKRKINIGFEKDIDTVSKRKTTFWYLK